MTTITFRDTEKGHSLPSSLFSFTARLADRWSRRQAAREIEAMPLDMRKDFGWPAADITEDRT